MASVATAIGANIGFCVWVSLMELRIDYEWTTGSAEGDGLSSDLDTSRTGQGTPYFSRRA